MSDGAPVDWEDEDGEAEREFKAHQAGSRRALLGTVGGGVALATSGLLLPEWLVEAAAAEHPVERVQHRKEQRRGKHHNQRQRRRDQQRRKRDQRDTPPGRHPVYDIAFLVENHRSADIAVWGETSDYENWPYWFGRQVIPSGQSRDYVSDDFQARIHIGMADYDTTSADVYADNPLLGWPEVTVEAWNGQSQIHPVFFKRYAVGEEGSLDAWDQHTRIHLDIKRLDDDDNTKHKRFRVTVS
jgi:hypothetical protein